MCRWIISFFSPDFFLLTCDSGKHNYTIWYIFLHNFILMVGLTCKKYNLYYHTLQVRFKIRIFVNLDFKSKTYILYLHNIITHCFYPPPKKNCIGIVSDFPWDIFMSQEKLQTMIMQTFGG